MGLIIYGREVGSQVGTAQSQIEWFCARHCFAAQPSRSLAWRVFGAKAISCCISNRTASQLGSSPGASHCCWAATALRNLPIAQIERLLRDISSLNSSYAANPPGFQGWPPLKMHVVDKHQLWEKSGQCWASPLSPPPSSQIMLSVTLPFLPRAKPQDHDSCSLTPLHSQPSCLVSTPDRLTLVLLDAQVQCRSILTQCTLKWTCNRQS